MKNRTSGKKQEKWFVSAKKADFYAIGQKYGIDPVIVRIIRNRDVVGDEALDEYLNGTLERLHDPGRLKGCREAAELLWKKISEKKKIRIIGDYDIDGVNSTYILYTAISGCGGIVDYEIPDRMKDGFGLNLSLLELALEEEVDTVITCDNGIAAGNEIQYAKERGMTVIVTDHHEPLFEDQGEKRVFLLPPADVIVDPKQPECEYPFKKICGAVVAWKVVIELYRISGRKASAVEEFLPFAAFATIGDVMDLEGENRIIVKQGLKRLSVCGNQGLQALIRVNQLNPENITAYHVGFVLGPCINASGRLDTAKRSLRLLLSDTKEEAEKLACELKNLNDERKNLTQSAVEQACEIIDSGIYSSDRVLVIYLPDCHESIAGIVAGKLRERYYRPVFVITKGEVSAKGSGRSIEGYSMFEEMVKCGDVFLKYGGHPMAAGFSLEESRIDEMRRRLNENCRLTEDEMTEKVSIDVPMPLNYIHEDLVRQLEILEPFGKGNEKPLFAEAHLNLLSARILGKNANVLKLRVMNQAGCVMDALYFGVPEEFQSYAETKFGAQAVRQLFWGRAENLEMDFTYYPSVNEYMGKKTLQIVIRNYR